MEGGEQTAFSPASAPKKNGSSAIVIVICIILALGGVGFGIFEMIQANNKETSVSNNEKAKDEKSTESSAETDCDTEIGEVTKDINAGQAIKVYNYAATKDGTRYVLRLSQHEVDGEKAGYFEIATIGASQTYEITGYTSYVNGKVVLSMIYDDETKSRMDDTANALGFSWAAGEGLYKKVEASFSADSVTLGNIKFEGLNK